MFYSSFFLDKFFDHEDGGSMFLRNVSCFDCSLLHIGILLGLLFDPEVICNMFFRNDGRFFTGLNGFISQKITKHPHYLFVYQKSLMTCPGIDSRVSAVSCYVLV
jgi:hypothetical protein